MLLYKEKGGKKKKRKDSVSRMMFFNVLVWDHGQLIPKIENKVQDQAYSLRAYKGVPHFHANLIFKDSRLNLFGPKMGLYIEIIRVQGVICWGLIIYKIKDWNMC
jgi:hypothetical protein